MTELLHSVQDGVAWVTFNRPQARNALTFAMYDGLAEICRALQGDRSVRALVLTGAGDEAFAAGTDIGQFPAFSAPGDAIAYEQRLENALVALETCRVPTIAAIAGFCVGGGAAIAACCDLRLGAANFRFGFPMARTLGNCLSLANYARLVALLGTARVKDLLMTTRLIPAPEASSIGLLREVIDDPAMLRIRAQALGAELSSYAPLTLEVTKEALFSLRPDVPSRQDNDLVLKCYMSRDFREGHDAFLEGRQPVWTGT